MTLSAAETTQEGCAGALSGEDVVRAPFKLRGATLSPAPPTPAPPLSPASLRVWTQVASSDQRVCGDEKVKEKDGPLTGHRIMNH